MKSPLPENITQFVCALSIPKVQRITLKTALRRLSRHVVCRDDMMYGFTRSGIFLNILLFLILINPLLIHAVTKVPSGRKEKPPRHAFVSQDETVRNEFRGKSRCSLCSSIDLQFSHKLFFSSIYDMFARCTRQIASEKLKIYFTCCCQISRARVNIASCYLDVL